MKLNKQLLAHTDAQPYAENVILSNNVKITVLTPEMVRVEYSAEKNFTDLPSQSIWYRNFGKVDFTYETKGDVTIVKTVSTEFYINNHSGDFQYVKYNDKKLTY